MPKIRSLDVLTVKQLRSIARKRDVTLRSQARKIEIVDMIKSSIPSEQMQKDIRYVLREAKKQQQRKSKK